MQTQGSYIREKYLKKVLIRDPKDFEELSINISFAMMRGYPCPKLTKPEFRKDIGKNRFLLIPQKIKLANLLATFDESIKEDNQAKPNFELKDLIIDKAREEIKNYLVAVCLPDKAKS